MKVGERNRARTAGRLHSHERIQSRQRDTHIRRMDGDAVFARAKDRMHTLKTLQRVAPRPRSTLVASRELGMHEVRAASPLQQGASIRGQIPELWRCTPKNRL